MKPGSIVRCVDDTDWDKYALQYFPSLPVKGGIYTVRRIIANLESSIGPPGVALEEIRGNWDFLPTYYRTTVYEEIHFRMNRFKEVLPPVSLNSLLDEIVEQPLLHNQ